MHCEGPGLLKAFGTRGGLGSNAKPEARTQALERQPAMDAPGGVTCSWQNYDI
jgi:hypothetical protein